MPYALADEVTSIVSRDAPGGTLVGLVALAVLAIWRGWLVPKRTVDELAEATVRIERLYAERLAESVARENEWRNNWAIERKRGDLQSAQIAELLELARSEITGRSAPR